MPTRNDPYQAESDDHQCSEPLEDADGREYQICQQAVGADRVIGGGEFPDPRTPPQAPAPGAAEGLADASDSDRRPGDEEDP